VTFGGRVRQWIVPIALVSLLLGSTATTSANPFLRGAEQPPLVLNIAHAGASSLAPQNTLAAGRLAFELGADVWGVDARLTSDSVFVLMHDETFDRTTDVEDVFPDEAPWLVEAFTLDEILQLDAGSWFNAEDPFGEIAAGNVSASRLESYVGEPVPTLREALELVAEHRWLIDVEIKPAANLGPSEAAQRLLDLIEDTGTADRVMVSSFDHGILRAIKEIDPTIPIGALTVFAPRDPLAYLNELRADVYLPSLVGFTEDLLEELLDAGIGVHLWTYNAEDQLERLVRTPGVSGIYTDYPQRLERVLKRLSRAESE